MKILIIEDEKPAAEHLERLLLKQAPHFRIVAKAGKRQTSGRMAEGSTDRLRFNFHGYQTCRWAQF
ncbi:MAG: hypothetical protein R3B93_03645 [Bacteroidia bacterium]